jgi:integrase
MDIKGVVQRGEYTYRFTVSCGFDGSGKHTRKTMTYKVPAGTAQGKAEKMVMQAYLDFEAKCKGTPRYSSNMRFKELAKIYLDEYGTYKLKPVTKYNYERDLELHILPVFGNKRVNSITTADLTNFFTTMNKASETTRKLRTVMSSVFSYGKSQGYIKENPCSGALYKTQVKQPQKVKYLDKEQCQKLMSLTSNYSIVNTIIQFILFTGLRIGECLGLTWDCIDFVSNTVTIRNNLSFAYDEWYLSTPKTEGSQRVIKLSDYTRNLLLVHKAQQDKSKALVGRAWTHPNVVFTSSIGNFFDRTYVNKYLKTLCQENGLPPVSIHKLRHSNASLLINSGAALKAVSDRLGHCNIAITADIYGHIFDSYEARMAQSLENELL